eukprot:10475622-Alexandrium_andersonii.AAC.1
MKKATTVLEMGADAEQKLETLLRASAEQWSPYKDVLKTRLSVLTAVVKQDGPRPCKQYRSDGGTLP